MSETIHYHQFNRMTGEAKLVIEEVSQGTLAKRSKVFQFKKRLPTQTIYPTILVEGKRGFSYKEKAPLFPHTKFKQINHK